MPWEPTVLRKYNTTGHFRLLNQLRAELKDNPLVRPKDGESIGEVNRSKALIRAIEGRSQGYGRGRRSAPAASAAPAAEASSVPQGGAGASVGSIGPEPMESDTFRQRLNAVDLR